MSIMFPTNCVGCNLPDTPNFNTYNYSDTMNFKSTSTSRERKYEVGGNREREVITTTTRKKSIDYNITSRICEYCEDYSLAMSEVILNKTSKKKRINTFLIFLLIIIYGVGGEAIRSNGALLFVVFLILLKRGADISKQHKYAKLAGQFPNLFFVYPARGRWKVDLEFYSRAYYENFKFVNSRNRNMSFKLKDDLNPRLLHPEQYEQIVYVSEY